MTRPLIIQAPAKINWGLAVGPRQPDGYHPLCSLMQSVSLCDTLRLSPAAEDSCLCTPPLTDGSGNLALKAWQLLKREYGLSGGLRIEIEKRIPLGGGLGGGSADAAAALKGVNRLFGLGLDGDALAALGLKLGADIPFCLRGGLARVEGRGERVYPLAPGPTYHLALANPGFPVSTAAVYAAFDQLPPAPAPDMAALERALLAGDMAAIPARAGNMLEAPAFALHPALAALKRACLDLGCAALMSGSGGSMWILAKDAAAAAAIAARLRAEYAFAQAVCTIAAEPDTMPDAKIRD